MADCFAELEGADGFVVSVGSLGSLECVLGESSDEGFIGSVMQARLRPATGSGACDNVINPDELPGEAGVVPNTIGEHSRGAGGRVIENYGEAETILESELGAIGWGWEATNFPRPLHSVSKLAAPPGGIKIAK